MKKLLLLSVILIGFLSSQPANAQKQKFYYYPASNVYYDLGGKQYAYYDGGNWIYVKTLPSHVRINQSSRAIVYHTGRNVWVGNAGHIKKYKTNKAKPSKVKLKGRA